MADPIYPNESEQYRRARERLLEAEMALRAQIEEVAVLRRSLPPGGTAPDYVFEGAPGAVTLADLFGDQETLIVYSLMYKGGNDRACPMCSAFLDSLSGQLKHIGQRTALVVAARAPYADLAGLFAANSWDDVPFVSAAGNDYPVDYRTELPDGSQLPMCNVFIRRDGAVRHFWASEMFFAPSPFHPRHIDMIWPLWHIFDLLPQGRGEFIPRLEY